MCVSLLLKAHCWLPVWGGGDNTQTLYSGQPSLGLTDWHSLVPPQLLRSRVSPTPRPTSLHACCCALLLSVPGRHERFLVRGPVPTASLPAALGVTGSFLSFSVKQRVFREVFPTPPPD